MWTGVVWIAETPMHCLNIMLQSYQPSVPNSHVVVPQVQNWKSKQSCKHKQRRGFPTFSPVGRPWNSGVSLAAGMALTHVSTVKPLARDTTFSPCNFSITYFLLQEQTRKGIPSDGCDGVGEIKRKLITGRPRSSKNMQAYIYCNFYNCAVTTESHT
jgi:hypothetical protein